MSDKERCIYGSTQEEHVTCLAYVQMDIQEGFLEQGTGFLVSLTLFSFNFLPHSHSFSLIDFTLVLQQ